MVQKFASAVSFTLSLGNKKCYNRIELGVRLEINHSEIDWYEACEY